jgi:hypothetical protein
MPKAQRSEIRSRYAAECFKIGIFDSTERKRIVRYLKFADHPLILRFRIFAKLWKGLNRPFLPPCFFEMPERHQGKHRYEGQLNYN